MHSQIKRSKGLWWKLLLTFLGTLSGIGLLLYYLKIDDPVAAFASVVVAIVPVVGLVVNSIYSDRNHRIQIMAHERSVVEITLRACDFMPESNEGKVSSKIGGALLALSTLNNHKLAVTLLGQLWEDERVSSDVAEYILTAAFNTNDPSTIELGSSILADNSGQIRKDHETYIWPIRPLSIMKNWSEPAKTAIAITASKWIASDLSKYDHIRRPQGVVVLFKLLNYSQTDKTAYQIAFLTLDFLANQTEFNSMPYQLGEENCSMAEVKEALDKNKGSSDDSQPYSAPANRALERVKEACTKTSP